MATKGFKQMIKCKICKKQILGTVWKMHVLGKKHLHFTPTKITITGMFDVNKVEDVHKYFSQFGTIGGKKVFAEDGRVSIEYAFQDRRAHSFIIYKDHYLFNQKLTISWEEVRTPLPLLQPARFNNKKPPKVNKPSSKRSDSDSSKQAILNNLKDAETFADQVLILQSKLQADAAENEKKKKIIHEDLAKALAPMFAINRIYFFGSSVTGLDVHGSDLDVYIANIREDIKPEVQSLKLVRLLIYKCRKFCDVLLIAGAKVPIIKCIHTETQMCCDLNIRNKLSVCNSQLIRYYLSLDQKLRPLMVFIKFWADCYDFKKVNFFSSYALYMMAIFYLQHEPYNIPSVKYLQENIAPDLVEGWNCAFELRGFPNATLQNESLLNLIVGFFKFYSNFDFATYVISPYLGKIIEKTCFIKPFDLPEGYKEYLINNQTLQVTAVACIQDPFEHARNVATCVPLNCLGKFVVMCRSSLLMFEKEQQQLLYKILTQQPQIDYIFKLDKPEDIDASDWIQSVKKMTHKIFTEVLNMDVDETESPNGIVYCCSSEHNIWDSRVNIRKNLSTQLPPDINEVDKEIAVTTCIVKYLKQTLPFECTAQLSYEQENANQIKFVLSPVSKKYRNFFHVSHFVAVKLQTYLKLQQSKNSENTSSYPSVQIEAICADFISSTQPHLSDMTHKSDKINDGKDRSGGSPGKHVRETSDGRTDENRTNGGETSKSDEENRNVNDEEEEDVPADFFDDFSNQDFMDGLDIVDAWDEDKLADSGDVSERRSSDRYRTAHSPIRYISKSPGGRRLRKQIRSRSKSLTRKYRRSSSHSRKRSRSKSRDKVRLSDRRDPEKTKRDIHRDKIKVAKDREQKIVNDKLRIVETGLVPPGMEMEADINSIFKDKERRSTTESCSDKMRDTINRDREVERPRKRTSGSREMIRKSLRISPSPPYSSVYRPRPPREMREPRELLHRPHKRTCSIDSNLSDRELWIRAGRKRTRSRSRESPRCSKSKKYEDKKKKTFLEEIRDKLNETSRPIQQVMPNPGPYNMGPYSNPTHSIGAPAPVPAPSQFFSQDPRNPTMQQYDQSFFIGDGYQMPQPQNLINPQDLLSPQPQNIGFGMMGNPGNVLMHSGSVQIQPVQVQPVQTPLHIKVPYAPILKPQALVSPKINLLSDIRIRSKLEEKKFEKDRIEDIDRLFADKKISLSDFLTITAKCEDQSSSPEHLQKKIKVISRCQDAIKAMSDDRKFNGKLCVKPSSENKNKTDVQYQSPLRRIPVVRFQFTTPAKMSEDSDSFTVALDKVLQKLGVLKENIDLDDSMESSMVKPNSSFADEEAAALTMKAAFLSAKKAETKSECEECKKRKSKIFADVGSQCVDNNDTATIATQVAEEDLTPVKGLPKNDSIAYLTTAQLLGKDKEKEKNAEREDKKTASMTPENFEKKQEMPYVSPMKKGKKPPIFKTRGGRKPPRGGRSVNNFYNEYEEEFDFYDGGGPAFEPPRENFGRRYGVSPNAAPGAQSYFGRQQFIEEEPHPMNRLHQFRDDETNFTDFPQHFRGRGGRFGPRY